ncbi:MAG: bifunctional riboflavin kinase/FAD synthetase [Gammaproteobacteria bacterium]|nr:bifunctional riboflavin kinase/FAD synthetase [Gammaproteobacteria bacterium]
MQVFRSLPALAALTARDRRGCIATIGAYDGVHLGHQEILRRVRERADERGVPSLVFSFEPIPREYFAADLPPPRLTRFRERAELFATAGIDWFFCPRFDARMQGIRSGEFIDRLLVGGIRPARVVIGDDFRFARNREGGLEELREAGSRNGFDVEQVGSVFVDGDRVSSTAIRAALQAGDLARAERMLGRPYRMSGRVVPGRRLGRELGFPTANVSPGRRSSPLSGIFAVRVYGLGAEALPGVASIGTRPTVEGDGQVVLETHLFDFSGDIYGRHIAVEFVARLRNEEKFASLPAMVEQMHRDCALAREILAA